MDKYFAALGLLICAFFALRMAAGPVRCQRFDQACRGRYKKLAARLKTLRGAALSAKPAKPVNPADPAAAQREAAWLIERARQRRQDVDQEGNVIRPRAFDPSKKKPPLH